jgi:hypothetical protein
MRKYANPQEKKFNGLKYEANSLYQTKGQAIQEQKELKKFGWNVRITKIAPYMGYNWQTWRRESKGYRSRKK